MASQAAGDEDPALMGKILMTLWPSYSYIHGNVAAARLRSVSRRRCPTSPTRWPRSGSTSRSGTLERGLPGLDVPALLIHGEGDPMPMRATTETAALIRGAEVEMIAQAGHFPWIEQRGRASARSSKTSFARSRSDGVVDYEKDPRVDAYIDALPEWQQEICRRVRDLVHAADPEVTETIKRTRQPYFVLDGNICALLAAKDHVNVFLYDGAIVPDPEGIITAGHENQTARTVAFREGEPINETALLAMFRQIIANNRAGGWRKLKQQT